MRNINIGNVWTITFLWSHIQGFGNIHTSMAAAHTLRMFHVEHFQYTIVLICKKINWILPLTGQDDDEKT